MFDTNYIFREGAKMDQKKEECMICLELLKYKKCIKTTCCRNIFHKECILKWLVYKTNNNTTCPNCRSIIEDSNYILSEAKNNVDFVDLNKR